MQAATFTRALHIDGNLTLSTFGLGDGQNHVATFEHHTGGLPMIQFAAARRLGVSVLVAQTAEPVNKTLVPSQIVASQHVCVYIGKGLHEARAALDDLPEPTIIVTAGPDTFAVWRLKDAVPAKLYRETASALAERCDGKASDFCAIPGTLRKGIRVEEVWFRKHLVYAPDDLAADANVSAPLQRADQITAPKMSWLWPSMIPLGQLTMLAGEPKIGKSQIAIDIAARVTRGDGWPDGSGGSAPGGVAILETEDPLGETLGRAEAAGAVMSRLLISDKHRDLSTREGVAALEKELAAIDNPRAIVLSPVRMFFGKETAAQVRMRNILMPILDMVQRRGIALIGVAHKEPGKKGRSTEEIAGPKVLTQRARAALTALADPTDPAYKANPKLARRLLVSAGGNNSPDGFELAYRCEGYACADGSPSSHIVWSQEKRTPTLMLPGPVTAESAEAWLREVLKAGGKTAGEVQAMAEAASIGRSTLFKAKARLGILSTERDGFQGGVTWSLPS